MSYPGTLCFSKSVAVLAAAILTSACASVLADAPNSPIAQREAEQMRAVLEENFQAYNEENLKKLLGTTSRFTDTPEQMAQFAAEAKMMFEDMDVYMRLVDFELIKFQPPRAYAKVTQLTLLAEEKGTEAERGGRKVGTTDFRSKSALLPEYELCTYKQRFNFEGGTWEVHRVVSQPEMATWPKSN
jgi:hypothetical protein